MDKKKVKIQELKKTANSKNENPIVIFAKNLLSGGKLLNFKKNIQLTNEEKRIFVRTYYVPMLYLLYSYYYTKFYKVQKIRTFKIENKFNYENMTLLFDKKNPAMKKINVYLYENFKKGKIEKISPIDENISNNIVENKDILIKFLENTNIFLEKYIDLINERSKKNSQIIYDLQQYLTHLNTLMKSLNLTNEQKSSDILDILKTIDKTQINIDEIYSNYKEALRLINNVNIDLILTNEYDKEEDIITLINFNSIDTATNIINKIKTKIGENGNNKNKYVEFKNKNDKLIDLLDDEKELIIGFLQKVKEDKVQSNTPKYISKFTDIKTKIYEQFKNISFNNKQFNTDKNNIEDLLNIIYRSIYISEDIENEYLNLKLKQTHTRDEQIKNKSIISFKFYIDNIFQRLKKEKKDETKIVDKKVEIFKKDIQDLKKKISTNKELHERESNTIAQKSKNIVKIDTDKKRENDERLKIKKIIDDKKAALQKFEREDQLYKDYKEDISKLSGYSSAPSQPFFLKSKKIAIPIDNLNSMNKIQRKIKELDEAKNSIPQYKALKESIESLETKNQTNIKNRESQDKKKKELEKNIEDYKKLKSLIEYKIKQTDDVLLNISSKKAEFNKKNKEEINFDEFKESYLSAFRSLNEISNTVKTINSKIKLNNSKNRFYLMLIGDSNNILKKILENPMEYKTFINDIQKVIENKEKAIELKPGENELFIKKLNKEIEVLKDMPSDVQFFFKKINTLDTEIWNMISNIIKEFNNLNKNTTNITKNNNIYKIKYDEYNTYMEKIEVSNNKTVSNYNKLIPYTDCIYMYFLSLFSIIEILTSIR